MVRPAYGGSWRITKDEKVGSHGPRTFHSLTDSFTGVLSSQSHRSQDYSDGRPSHSQETSVHLWDRHAQADVLRQSTVARRDGRLGADHQCSSTKAVGARRRGSEIARLVLSAPQRPVYLSLSAKPAWTSTALTQIFTPGTTMTASPIAATAGNFGQPGSSVASGSSKAIGIPGQPQVGGIQSHLPNGQDELSHVRLTVHIDDAAAAIPSESSPVHRRVETHLRPRTLARTAPQDYFWPSELETIHCPISGSTWAQQVQPSSDEDSFSDHPPQTAPGWLYVHSAFSQFGDTAASTR